MTRRLFLGGSLDRTRRTVSDPAVYVVPVIDDPSFEDLDPDDFFPRYPSTRARTESYELKRVGIGRGRRTTFVYALQGLTDDGLDALLLNYIDKGAADV